MSPRSSRRAARPVGRRPGDPEDTKADILAAARRLFGEVGFERATIRAIAELADVDPALVIHHFTTKQKLFIAAHELPFDPSDLLDEVEQLPPGERGEAIARVYLTGIFAAGSPGLSLLRTAATNEDAARMLSEFVTSALLGHADRLAPGPDGRRRMALAGAQLVGVVFGRSILQLEPLARADVDELIAAVAPVVQHYLDGDGTDGCSRV